MKKNYFISTLLIAIFCGIGFGVLADLIEDQNINLFDKTVISAVQNMENPMLTYLMNFFTVMGDSVYVVIICFGCMAVFYYLYDYRFELLLLIHMVFGSALLNLILKVIFQRNRPVIHRIIEANGFSFPSGHSMAAFSLYGAILFLLWKHIRTISWRIFLLIISSILIVCIGISRVYLGVHYPSDVIGGYMASGCFMGFSIWIYQCMMHNHKSKKGLFKSKLDLKINNL